MLRTQTTDLFGNVQYIPIKAIGWNQPFASLMLHGKIETRMWDTAIRGPVLIYSTLEPYPADKMFEDCTERMINEIANILLSEPTAELFGYAIAVADLVKTRPMTRADEKRCFIKYKSGRWCHIYENIRRIEPFKFQDKHLINLGKQGWSTIEDPFILDQVKIIQS